MGLYPVLGLLLCLSVGLSEGGKLLVAPVDGSHWLSMKILVKELVARGHEVVVLVPETSLLIKDSQSYSTIIYKVPNTKEQLDTQFNELRKGIFLPPQTSEMMENVNRLVNFTTLQATGCESLLQCKALMDQLKGEGFDALPTDPFLPCGSILARIYSIPTVYFLSGLPCQLDTRANQCPSPPSFVPIFSDNTDKMNFPQRVKNTLSYVLETYMCTVMYANFDDLVSRYIDKDMSYQRLLGEGAIWLLKYDFTFEWPRPIMPNMVFIGGINCAKTAPLPAYLEEFVEGSGDDGFIVFTMGSMVSNMPIEMAKLFFEAFRQILQRVLWRYEGEVPANAPKNVKPMKWLPQKDLLGGGLNDKTGRPFWFSLRATMNTFYIAIVLCLIPLSGGSDSGIVGGEIAEPHSRKYMASLQSYGNHICGGFLIRDDFVLTAAHCTRVLPMMVVLGAHDITKKETSQQKIQVEEFIQHPKYVGAYDFDIMLLKLKQKAKLNDFGQTIDPPQKDKPIRALKECSVAGWGMLHPSKNSRASDVLRVAEEKIQFNFECKKIWKENFNPQHMICTKFNKKGSMCQGDSGGPLICKNKPLGITAFTKQDDCSNPKYPHGYTKISSFLPWIKKVMGGLGNESFHLNKKKEIALKRFGCINQYTTKPYIWERKRFWSKIYIFLSVLNIFEVYRNNDELYLIKS